MASASGRRDPTGGERVEHVEHVEGERLQKVLARAGLGSRRACEELIADRRVTVDGETAVLGRRVDPETDRIEVDGVRVLVDDTLVHYLLNKPAGVVTTASDPQGRPTVVQLVPAEPRVFPVGRLDADTEGLLVLTNDGELTQLLTHPSHGVVKTYLAEVEGRPSPAALRRLREGIDLDDGPTAPAKVNLVQPRAGSAAVEIGLHEGRNRQVRRMLDAVGHPVVRLVRTRIGPVADRSLRPGEWRVLTREEVRSLYAAAGAQGGDAGADPPVKGPGAAGAPG
jgi:23S rRNA pseudouridine2605 synthase